MHRSGSASADNDHVDGRQVRVDRTAAVRSSLTRRMASGLTWARNVGVTGAPRDFVRLTLRLWWILLARALVLGLVDGVDGRSPALVRETMTRSSLSESLRWAAG